MTFVDKLKAILMIPKARVHVIKTMHLLETQSYQKTICQTVKSTKINRSINVIVKSYFWASRTIKNDNCLPRSIALYQKLRASGYHVEHKFGVNKKKETLAAHAWVEYQNKPLNESEDLKQRINTMNYPD